MSSSLVLSSLNGLSALVTGGSSGLGLATAQRLSKHGCTVAIVDVNEPKQLPPNCYFIKVDVTKEDDILKALDIIENRAGKLDILVNCAGIYLSKPVFDTKTQTPHALEEYEKIFQVNTTGTFNVIRLCCSLFNKNQPNENKQRGVIINTSSCFGLDGPLACSAYGSSKAAIAGMTLPLARDLAPMGVRVMAISPGAFLTPMLELTPPHVRNLIIETIPFPKRFGHPDEYAHLVQSIIENPMLNGEVIRIDGAVRCIAPADQSVL